MSGHRFAGTVTKPQLGKAFPYRLSQDVGQAESKAIKLQISTAKLMLSQFLLGLISPPTTPKGIIIWWGETSAPEQQENLPSVVSVMNHLLDKININRRVW
jgi:hypothetical protein